MMIVVGPKRCNRRLGQQHTPAGPRTFDDGPGPRIPKFLARVRVSPASFATDKDSIQRSPSPLVNHLNHWSITNLAVPPHSAPPVPAPMPLALLALHLVVQRDRQRRRGRLLRVVRTPGLEHRQRARAEDGLDCEGGTEGWVGVSDGLWEQEMA